MSDVLRRSLREFGTSIFSTVTEWAIEANAINLSQGFPDFEPPAELVAAAEEAMHQGLHQYAPSVGDPVLRQAVAEHQLARYGLAWDPVTDVTVTTGASEAITASLLALLEPGDEVVLIEPCYDLYPYAVVAAGGVPVYVPTAFPDFRLDLDRLAAAVTDRTRVIVVNTPTNPTGQLLSAEEISMLGELAARHDAYLISDEVYEHLVYDGLEHLPVASDPVARERTITVSSVSKTFSATGWRIGWAVAPPAAVGGGPLGPPVRHVQRDHAAAAGDRGDARRRGDRRLLPHADGAVHRAAGHPAGRAGRARPGDRPAAGDVLRDDPVRRRRHRLRQGPHRLPRGGRDPRLGLLLRRPDGSGPGPGPVRVLQAGGHAANCSATAADT